MEGAEEKKYLTLSDISAYRLSLALSERVWKNVVRWERFSKETIGNQFVRSVDSISANIAEGFGRYHKKDKIKFYRYSFGSAMEALDWNQKAFVRKLVVKEEYEIILRTLKDLPKEIHSLIKFTNEKLKE